MATRIIENPTCDNDLPEATQQLIRDLMAEGWIRPVLMITAHGGVLVDPEAVEYDRAMQAESPGRPRSEYLPTLYPLRIYVDEE